MTPLQTLFAVLLSAIISLHSLVDAVQLLQISAVKKTDHLPKRAGKEHAKHKPGHKSDSKSEPAAGRKVKKHGHKHSSANRKEPAASLASGLSNTSADGNEKIEGQAAVRQTGEAHNVIALLEPSFSDDHLPKRAGKEHAKLKPGRKSYSKSKPAADQKTKKHGHNHTSANRKEATTSLASGLSNTSTDGNETIKRQAAVGQAAGAHNVSMASRAAETHNGLAELQVVRVETAPAVQLFRLAPQQSVLKSSIEKASQENALWLEGAAQALAQERERREKAVEALKQQKLAAEQREREEREKEEQREREEHEKAAETLKRQKLEAEQREQVEKAKLEQEKAVAQKRAEEKRAEREAEQIKLAEKREKSEAAKRALAARRMAFRAEFDETGYKAVVATNHTEAAKIFLRRLLDAQHLHIINNTMMSDMIRFYDGTCGVGSYASLLAELGTTMPDSECPRGGAWVEEDKGHTKNTQLVEYYTGLQERLPTWRWLSRALVGDALTDGGDGWVAHTERENADQVMSMMEQSHLSHLWGVMSGRVGESAQLDPEGYMAVAKVKNPVEMTTFIQRVAKQQGLEIINADMLHAMLPYYDGECDTQTYNILLSELQRAQKLPEACGGAWVVAA